MPAVAVADEMLVEVAVKVASAAGALTAPVRNASVWMFAIVSASDPATDTEPAAPESASLE